MLSMKDIATLTTVIEICNNPNLKKEILCAPGSDYDRNKGNSVDGNNLRWNEIVEEKATEWVKNSGLGKQLQEKIISLVFSVGMRMLIWAEYHEVILGISREYIVLFLNNSFFTPQGIIDGKKAAEELLKTEILTTKQRYKLACLYCFTDRIPVLFREMTAEDKKEFYNAESPHSIQQPELIKFWSYHLMNDVEKLKEGKTLDHCRLEKAVRSGSKTAVEYCLEETNLRKDMNAVIHAAVEAIRCRMVAEQHTGKNRVFQNQLYKDCENHWVPNDYYIDILYFLLSKMQEDQHIEFFQKDINLVERRTGITWNFKFEVEVFAGIRINLNKSEEQKLYFVVLEYLLNWPYQDYFMKEAKLMWVFLSGGHFAVLLLMICDKIESKNLFSKYGEGKTFNYRELLKEFWCQSPDHLKRQVFINQALTYRSYTEIKTGVGLLIKLLTLKNFTYEDGEIVKLILSDATAKEKEKILLTEEWTRICVKLIEEEKWETLERYTLHCFLTKNEESKFKRDLSFNKITQLVCIDFAKYANWNAAESFVKWSSLPEEEIKKLKKEMIYSDLGLLSCLHKILSDKVRAIEFIRWFLPSEGEVKVFRKDLILSDYVTDAYIRLIANKQNKQELVSDFINFCLPSEGEERELKKEAAYRYGGIICKDLISDNEAVDENQSYEGLINRRIKFKGGKWEDVEKFLTLYFSSEEEISDFKKKLLKDYGKEIHFQLIESNQWEEAETFFAWLELSVDEIKELKKSTLLDHSEAREMFIELINSEDDDERFRDYGSKQEAIKLLLRWYLTDKQIVTEFKEDFLQSLHEEFNDELYENLDLIIEQHLRDLEDENMAVKRTIETLPLIKDLEIDNKRLKFN